MLKGRAFTLNYGGTMRIEFTKVAGAGNDFILIDIEKQRLPDRPQALARALCAQHTGIGADGLVVFERVADQHFRIACINPDMSTATMCGNAVRCAARYAMKKYRVSNPAISMSGNTYQTTAAGSLIQVSVIAPTAFRGPFPLAGRDGYFINAGTEHAVLFSPAVGNPPYKAGSSKVEFSRTVFRGGFT